LSAKHAEKRQNQLNEVKPEMIEAATKNARIASDQFARDSQTTLGKLQTASQGWFQVENQDGRRLNGKPCGLWLM